MSTQAQTHAQLDPSLLKQADQSAPQSIASAALRFLNESTSPQRPDKVPNKQLGTSDVPSRAGVAAPGRGMEKGREPVLPLKVTPPATPPKDSIQRDGGNNLNQPTLLALGAEEQALSAVVAAAPITANVQLAPAASRPLSPLLRYVDYDLMQSASLHNHPPKPDDICPICDYQWNLASIPTTFLPLSPCGHWVHYRCFIWWTTRIGDRRDKCVVCNTRLFQWDGINALTLATRTGFELEDTNWGRIGYTDPHTNSYISSDSAEYIADCDFIDKIITTHFLYVAPTRKFPDESPNLTQSYYDILNEMDRSKRPVSKWLQWNTNTGFLLFGMLVAIKMRRFLTERYARVIGTMGWTNFEAGRQTLQSKILEEVNESDELYKEAET